jgi:hypothetical protein
MGHKKNFFRKRGVSINFSMTLLQTLDVSTLFSLTAFRGGLITPNGLQIVEIDYGPDTWQIMNLGTAWDLSTATFFGIKATGNSSPFGSWMSEDGLRGGTQQTNHSIKYGTMGAAYDFNTYVWTSQKSVGSLGNYPKNPKFNGDGTVVFSHSQAASYYLYSAPLSTPYDFGTIGIVSNDSAGFFSTVDWDFLGNGNYILTTAGGNLNLFPLSTPYDPTTYGASVWSDTLINAYNLQVVDSQNLIFLYQSDTGDIYKYSFTI